MYNHLHIKSDSPALPCILSGQSKNLHDSIQGVMIPAVDETLGAKQQRVSLRALPPLRSPRTHRDRESQHPEGHGPGQWRQTVPTVCGTSWAKQSFPPVPPSYSGPVGAGLQKSAVCF